MKKAIVVIGLILLVGMAGADPFIGNVLRYDIDIKDGIDITALGETDLDLNEGMISADDAVITNDTTIGGTLDVDGATTLDTVAVSEGVTFGTTVVNASTYTVLSTDYYIFYHYGEYGTCTLNIPTDQLVMGRTLHIIDAAETTGLNTLTITTGGSETIGLAATHEISTNATSLSITADTTPTVDNWVIF